MWLNTVLRCSVLRRSLPGVSYIVPLRDSVPGGCVVYSDGVPDSRTEFRVA